MAENLNVSQVDTRGRANSELWRYGIEDLERLPFAGQGVWRSVGPAPLIVSGDQHGQGIGPDAGEVVDIAIRAAAIISPSTSPPTTAAFGNPPTAEARGSR
jgi:hypothetical protein